MHNLNGQISTEYTEKYHPCKLPIWVQRPKLLGAIVQDTLELGRADLAAENNLVTWHTCRKWLEHGKKELEEDQDYDTISVLSQFYLEIQQAKSLFISNRLKKVIALADTNNPRFSNFHLWLLENVDEGKRFAPWQNINQKTEETKNVTITVRYADGREWTNGPQSAIIGDVIDTELKQIEDF